MFYFSTTRKGIYIQNIGISTNIFRITDLPQRYGLIISKQFIPITVWLLTRYQWKPIPLFFFSFSFLFFLDYIPLWRLCTRSQVALSLRTLHMWFLIFYHASHLCFPLWRFGKSQNFWETKMHVFSLVA